jgi:hypothetical protein
MVIHHESPPEKGIWMQQDRLSSFAQFVREAIQSPRVIGMTMAQDNGVNAAEINTKQLQVVQGFIGVHTCIKQEQTVV